MAKRLALIGLALIGVAVVLAVAVYNYEDVLRMPSPGGEFELVSGGPESSSTSSFYIVRAGLQPRPEDEVLRTDALAGCPEILKSPPPSSQQPYERSVLCSASTSFSWVSPSEVEFEVSETVRIFKHVAEAHGVRIRVRRLP
jgi:hypothetical protein